MSAFSFNVAQATLILGIIVVSALLGCIPGYQAYKHSLSDGMTIKL
jgi:putative ABC transport system permease protein